MGLGQTCTNPEACGAHSCPSFFFFGFFGKHFIFTTSRPLRVDLQCKIFIGCIGVRVYGYSLILILWQGCMDRCQCKCYHDMFTGLVIGKDFL